MRLFIHLKEDKNTRKLRNKSPYKKHEIEAEEQYEVESTETSPNSLKLTIKIGGQTLGEKRFTKNIVLKWINYLISITKSSIHSVASNSTNRKAIWLFQQLFKRFNI